MIEGDINVNKLIMKEKVLGITWNETHDVFYFYFSELVKTAENLKPIK